MDVILAETAGFCMGVDLALNRLNTLLEEEEGRPVHILGPIIHNPQVLERYARRGVHIAKHPEDIPPGAVAVIRAHGIPCQVEDDLRSRGILVMDATCPKVKKAQILIRRHTAQGAVLLLYGEEAHPEVRGLVSYAGGDTFVFGSSAELGAYPLEPGQTYVLAAQTTQDRAEFDAMAERLSARTDVDVDVLSTICDATKMRQEEAKSIAAQVEYMVVVGGLDSGNTRRLAQVVRDQGTPSVHVETVDDLPLDDLRGLARVGLTAGASTPSDLVAGVLQALKSL